MALFSNACSVCRFESLLKISRSVARNYGGRTIGVNPKKLLRHSHPCLVQCGRPLSLSKCTLNTSSSKPPSSRQGPVTWKSLAAIAVAGGAVLAYVKYLKNEKEKEKEKERRRAVGMAALGGPYELIDHNGKPTSDKDFHGQWVLMYFGFTHCPDICPDQLEKMGHVIEALDKTKGIPKIQPLFVSVDPYRDDPKSIKEYLKEFHPRLIGLTGTEAQVKGISKAFRVYYSAGPKDEDKDYIVDHTIIMYLIDPNGQFMEYFGQNRTESDIVGTIANRMLSHKHS